MSNDNYDSTNRLESFYVFRTLHSDESWDAILGICGVVRLPNIDFGMMVYAANVKEAIARGRHLYEKIHKWDSDRDNVRRFVAAALKSTTAHYIGKGPLSAISDEELDEIGKATIKMALAANKEYKAHFDRMDKLRNEDTKKEI